MELETFALNFEIPVDEDGIGDGLSVALAMVKEAHRMVALYTKGCPACTGSVLGSMFDMAMDGQPLVDGAYTEKRVIASQRFNDEPGVLDALEDHLDRTRVALQYFLSYALTRGGAPHTH